MSSTRQFWNALALAVISLISVLGGISLSLAENVSTKTEFIPSPTETQIQSVLVVPTLVTITPTLPEPINTSTPSETATLTNTPLPAPSCPPPPSTWAPITTHTGDTLQTIAIIYKTTPEQIKAINCLLVDTLIPNTTLYVPILAASTAVTNTVLACGAPAGWVKNYSVQPGNTLFSISQSFGVPLATMQKANCIGNDYLILVGQVLWVPNVPTRTPTLAQVFIPSSTSAINTNPTEPLTLTPLPYTATYVPTNTPQPTLTASPTAIP
jgi:LysM repeat protein